MIRPRISAKSAWPKLFDVRHRRRGVGILVLEIGPDLGLENGGIVHHLLPVVGPEPGVVVGAGDAVMDSRDRPPDRDRGRHLDCACGEVYSRGCIVPTFLHDHSTAKSETTGYDRPIEVLIATFPPLSKGPVSRPTMAALIAAANQRCHGARIN